MSEHAKLARKKHRQEVLQTVLLGAEPAWEPRALAGLHNSFKRRSPSPTRVSRLPDNGSGRERGSPDAHPARQCAHLVRVLLRMRNMTRRWVVAGRLGEVLVLSLALGAVSPWRISECRSETIGEGSPVRRAVMRGLYYYTHV